MSKFFSANQYEDAFRPKRLQNWQLPSMFKERPTKQEGFTQIISNDRGHLLDGIKKTKDNPWGDFVGTWDLPKQIPGNAVVNNTARRYDCHDSLMRQRKTAQVKLLGDEKNQIRSKHVNERKVWVEEGKGRARKRQGVQARTRTPTLKYMPSSSRLPPLHERKPEEKGLPPPRKSPASSRKSKSPCSRPRTRSPAVRVKTPGSSRGKSPGKSRKVTPNIATPPFFTPRNSPSPRRPKSSPKRSPRRSPRSDDGECVQAVTNINKNNINVNANIDESSEAAKSPETSPTGHSPKNVPDVFVDTPVEKLFHTYPSPTCATSHVVGDLDKKTLGLDGAACSNSSAELHKDAAKSQSYDCSRYAAMNPTKSPNARLPRKSPESAARSPNPSTMGSPKESTKGSPKESPQPQGSPGAGGEPQLLMEPEQQCAYELSPFPPSTPKQVPVAKKQSGKLIF